MGKNRLFPFDPAEGPAPPAIGDIAAAGFGKECFPAAIFDAAEGDAGQFFAGVEGLGEPARMEPPRTLASGEGVPSGLGTLEEHGELFAG